MECATAQALFEEYSATSAEYFRSADKLADLVGSHVEFEASQLATEQLHTKCRAAFSALDKHRREHGCAITG